jgi:hypothetical protein
MTKHLRIRTVLAALVLALAFTGLNERQSRAETIPLSFREIPLNPANPDQGRIGRLSYMGGLMLWSGDQRFGGLSGLTISADGRQMLAVSDHGFWFSGRIQTNGRGWLIGVDAPALDPILNEHGAPVEGAWRDAEAVEYGSGSSFIVSFERRHRLWRYDDLSTNRAARAKPIEVPRNLAKAPKNGGIEALAVMTDGRLLALSEDMDVDGGDKMGWILHLQGAGHSTVSYRPGSNFKPTDMAALPNGDVLVLERRYTPVAGVAARIARLAAESVHPKARLRGEELALIQPPLNVDNMEGLAVTMGSDGATYLYILSDDNYSRGQRTLLMKFRLDPPQSE